MEITARRAIGAALILAAVLQGCGERSVTQAGFREAPTDDGRRGFVLVLTPEAWQRITKHGAGMTSAGLDDQVHAAVSELVEAGIARTHLPCSHHWLMSDFTPTDRGGMLFTGFCASAEELRTYYSRPGFSI
jgi:hypothetical protein